MIIYLYNGILCGTKKNLKMFMGYVELPEIYCESEKSPGQDSVCTVLPLFKVEREDSNTWCARTYRVGQK